MDYNNSTANLKALCEICVTNNKIDGELYIKHQVNRGLRDLNGRGVLTGLTEISDVISTKKNEKGEREPCHGELRYRGINVEGIINGFTNEKRFGFEEVIYLLLFGQLPTKTQLADFNVLLGELRCLPEGFLRSVILGTPSKDIMNSLAKSVISFYVYDENPDDTTIQNVLRQCLSLISALPVMAVYGYQAFNHYHKGQSLFIHEPDKNLSTSQNILHLLRPDSSFTELEASILDVALVLHAEHGGGNNSSFTTHVVSSSGTDTYSTTCASLGSLKGPKHGGANLKVLKMFDDLKENVKQWSNEGQITDYLSNILNKQAFDNSGLIYGMGHAVYSLSDPRARIFKGFVKSLSQEKGREEEFELYQSVERIAAQLISEKRKIYKGVSANVDFYSGFVYDMLNLPKELYTPIFAVARVAGWSAHRLEELINAGKIIRPAYMGVSPQNTYVALGDR